MEKKKIGSFRIYDEGVTSSMVHNISLLISFMWKLLFHSGHATLNCLSRSLFSFHFNVFNVLTFMTRLKLWYVYSYLFFNMEIFFITTIDFQEEFDRMCISSVHYVSYYNSKVIYQ